MLVCSGYSLGPARYGAGNETGSTGGPKTCGGSTCHGNNNPNTQDTITVIDKTSGLPTLSYKPGQTYTVTLSGSNAVMLPKFGFQVSATLLDKTQAGSMIVTAAKTQQTTVGGITLMENSNSIDTILKGRYFTQFDWIAPDTGSGYVTFYGILCAVNGDGYANSSDQANPANELVLHEWTTGVENSSSKNNGLKIYPNPVIDHLYIRTGTGKGTYLIRIYSSNGREIVYERGSINCGMLEINTGSWDKGVYFVEITADGIPKALQVLKQ